MAVVTSANILDYAERNQKEHTQNNQARRKFAIDHHCEVIQHTPDSVKFDSITTKVKDREYAQTDYDCPNDDVDGTLFVYDNDSTAPF